MVLYGNSGLSSEKQEVDDDGGDDDDEDDSSVDTQAARQACPSRSCAPRAEKLEAMVEKRAALQTARHKTQSKLVSIGGMWFAVLFQFSSLRSKIFLDLHRLRLPISPPSRFRAFNGAKRWLFFMWVARTRGTTDLALHVLRGSSSGVCFL